MTAGFATTLSRITQDLAGLPDDARYCSDCRCASSAKAVLFVAQDGEVRAANNCHICAGPTVSVAQARRDVERAAAWVAG